MTIIKLVISVKEVAKNVGLDSTILTFRPFGIDIKEHMLKLINKPYSSIEINFAGVEICDVSFVDEVVLNFKDELNIKKLTYKSGLLPYLSNCSKGILINLEAAILHKEKKEKGKYPILLSNDGLFEIVGGLERNLLDTFELLLENKVLTASQISDICNIEINSASNRLKKLYDLGLIDRNEEIDNSGKRYIYSLPTE